MISAEYIKQKALEVGFDSCGIARAGAMPQFAMHLKEWLSRGHQADMHYMEELTDMRANPQLLVEGAQSVVSLAVGYRPDKVMKGNCRIAQYAYGEDYHIRIKRMLFQLVAAIKERYPDFEAKPCVDTVPISDKWWAALSGLGWIGRNTLLVTPEMGSWVNLGELVTTAEVDCYDAPIENRCGTCDLCVRACPNGAIGEYGVDSCKCNAYNTIENRSEHLPQALRLSGYAFGCDCCQLSCPYNQKTPTKTVLSESQIQDLSSLEHADESTFKRFAKHSAMNRIKYSQWQRNVAKAKEG